MEQLSAIIDLFNSTDVILASNTLFAENEIRYITVDALIHNKGYPVCLNEEIAQKLELKIAEKRQMITDDNKVVELDVADNVQIQINGRITTCRAIIQPGNSRPVISRTLFNYLTLPYIRI